MRSTDSLEKGLHLEGKFNKNFSHIHMSGMSTVLGVKSSKFSMLLEKAGFIPLEGFLDPGKEDVCNVRNISKK